MSTKHGAIQLAQAMRSMAGKAILSINDHPDMRRVFAGFKTQRVAINYQMGGAQKPKSASELIIQNQ